MIEKVKKIENEINNNLKACSTHSENVTWISLLFPPSYQGDKNRVKIRIELMKLKLKRISFEKNQRTSFGSIQNPDRSLNSDKESCDGLYSWVKNVVLADCEFGISNEGAI